MIIGEDGGVMVADGAPVRETIAGLCVEYRLVDGEPHSNVLLIFVGLVP